VKRSGPEPSEPPIPIGRDGADRTGPGGPVSLQLTVSTEAWSRSLAPPVTRVHRQPLLDLAGETRQVGSSRPAEVFRCQYQGNPGPWFRCLHAAQPTAAANSTRDADRSPNHLARLACRGETRGCGSGDHSWGIAEKHAADPLPRSRMLRVRVRVCVPESACCRRVVVCSAASLATDREGNDADNSEGGVDYCRLHLVNRPPRPSSSPTWSLSGVGVWSPASTVPEPVNQCVDRPLSRHSPSRDRGLGGVHA
jgi:hypothetical protein